MKKIILSLAALILLFGMIAPTYALKIDTWADKGSEKIKKRQSYIFKFDLENASFSRIHEAYLRIYLSDDSDRNKEKGSVSLNGIPLINFNKVVNDFLFCFCNSYFNFRIFGV